MERRQLLASKADGAFLNVTILTIQTHARSGTTETKAPTDEIRRLDYMRADEPRTRVLGVAS